MRDLTLISSRHQRYEQGVPVRGVQYCKRAIIIKNQDFRELIDIPDYLLDVEGFVVKMYNMDAGDSNGYYPEMMSPKLMQLVSDEIDKIELRGVPLLNFSDYAITLHLINRKVDMCVLHMLDRDIDIEYMDINK